MANTRNTSGEIAAWKANLLLLSVLALLCLSACGRTLGTQVQSPFPNVPFGTGNNPELGTKAGDSQVSSTGHTEFMVTADNVAYLGSDNGRLYAFNATSGKIEWQRLLGGPVDVDTVAGGVVYATINTGGSSQSTNSSVVYALSAASGQVLWQFSRPNTYVVTVVVSDGIVFAGTGSEGNQQTIFAIAASTGHLLWQRTQATSIPGLLGAAGGVVFTAEVTNPTPSGRSTLVALDAGTGKILWQMALQPNEGGPGGLPAQSNGVLYMETSGGALYAVQAASGAVLWHVPVPQVMGPSPLPLLPVPLSPALTNGVLYSASPIGIAAYRATDGTVVWHYQNRMMGPFLPHPVLVSGVIYVNTSNGAVALRASDGTVLWQSPSGVDRIHPLLVTDGVVIGNSSTVYGLRASDGSQIWQSTFSPEGTGHAGPGGQSLAVGTSSSGGVVYIGSDDGVVHALRASDGNQLWHYAIPELAVPLPPVFNAYVAFTSSTTFVAALEAVTNLGLKTYLPCTPGWTNLSSLQTGFARNPTLWVTATVASAPVWYDRLKALPFVATTQPNAVVNCPLEQPDNGPTSLTEQQAGTYLKATFSGATSYDTTLESIDGLGFRLASPCYEQKRANGSKPTWQPLSQQASLSQSHSLVLATTTQNSTIWLQQLQSLAGVQAVTSPYTANC